MDSSMQWTQWIGWGELVQVAYDMYKQNKVAPPTPANFPAGWVKVANLTMIPHLEAIKEREFAGFIAQSVQNPLHQAVVFRGTESPMDWLADFEFFKKPFVEVSGSGETEDGFTNLYRSTLVEFADSTATAPTLMAYLDQMDTSTAITVTGHSLGGALATLHAYVAASKQFAVELITFASPRVGNKAFVEAFQQQTIDSTRIFNQPDVVPTVPPELAGYQHVETGVEINSLTYPDIKHSIVAYHSLSTYLYVMKAMSEPATS